MNKKLLVERARIKVFKLRSLAVTSKEALETFKKIEEDSMCMELLDDMNVIKNNSEIVVRYDEYIQRSELSDQEKMDSSSTYKNRTPFQEFYF